MDEELRKRLEEGIKRSKRKRKREEKYTRQFQDPIPLRGHLLISAIMLLFTAFLILLAVSKLIAQQIPKIELSDVIQSMKRSDPLLTEYREIEKKLNLDLDLSLSYNPIKNDFGITISLKEKILKDLIGSDSEKVLRAKIKEREIQIEITAVRLWSEWMMAVKEVEHAKNAFLRADDILKIAKVRFKAGDIPPESLINTYSAYENARRRYEKAVMDEKVKRYELLKRMGKDEEIEGIFEE